MRLRYPLRAHSSLLPMACTAAISSAIVTEQIDQVIRGPHCQVQSALRPTRPLTTFHLSWHSQGPNTTPKAIETGQKQRESWLLDCLLGANGFMTVLLGNRLIVIHLVSWSFPIQIWINLPATTISCFHYYFFHLEIITFRKNLCARNFLWWSNQTITAFLYPI